MYVPNITISVPQPYNKIGDGPEGPEIFHISNYLNSVSKHKTIDNIKILPDSRYNKSGIVNSEMIKGCIITKVYPYGKKIIFVFDNYLWMIFSLGLEGTFKYIEKTSNNIYPKHSSILISFASGDSLLFSDSRHFGNVVITTNYKLSMKDVGPSWIQGDVELEKFIGVVKSLKKNTKKSIAEFLLEQKYFSGIGNYLRSDILYHAKVDPFKLVIELDNDELERVFKSANKVINSAVECKGTFSKVYNDGGCYSPIVYGRMKTSKNEKVERTKDKNGRMIHWVP